MTKTLTEQWKDGELPEGYYYIRWSFDIEDEPSYMIDFYDRENFVGGAFINKQPKFIDEIVSAVPSYEEWKRLQEQLKESNELLLDFCSENECRFDHNGYCQEHDSCECGYKCIQKDLKQYIKKWGVK